MSRRPLFTGCCVFGSVSAYFGLLLAPSPSVWFSGVPGLATNRPICEYVRPDVAPKVWIRMYFAKQRASEPFVTCSFATEQSGVWIGEGVIFTPAAWSLAISWFCAV